MFEWEFGRLERLVDLLPTRPDVAFLEAGDADPFDDERGTGGVEVLACRTSIWRSRVGDVLVDRTGLGGVAWLGRRWPESSAFGRGVLVDRRGLGGKTLLGRGGPTSATRGGDVRVAGSGVGEAAKFVRRERVATLKEADGATDERGWESVDPPTPGR